MEPSERIRHISTDNISAQEFNRYRNKSVPQLIKLATTHFNKYIRNRDSQDGFFQCISCRSIKSISQMNAGHYWPTTKSGTRFDEDNVHGQCVKCNHFLSGNLVEYQRALRAMLGDESYESLEARAHVSKRWDKFELVGIIITYRELNKLF